MSCSLVFNMFPLIIYSNIFNIIHSTDYNILIYTVTYDATL